MNITLYLCVVYYLCSLIFINVHIQDFLGMISYICEGIIVSMSKNTSICVIHWLIKCKQITICQQTLEICTCMAPVHLKLCMASCICLKTHLASICVIHWLIKYKH